MQPAKGLRPALSPVDGAPQRFNFLASGVAQVFCEVRRRIDAPAGRVPNALAGFAYAVLHFLGGLVGPVAHGVERIVISAFDVLA